MVEAAFWAGYNARLRGDDAVTCPHPTGSAERDEWLEGWRGDLFERHFGRAVETSPPGTASGASSSKGPQ
ncbi:hypothetical protein KX816_15285 [Sphingosinicellaceae bacterium]|nr:hypothetical protein KX816_15285 [Sphingosinicellaceae bacterium]